MRSLNFFRRVLLAAFCFTAGAMLGIPSFAQQAKLQKLTWGNPDQPWGVRRPVTDADRKAVALYRSGKIQPVYATNFDDSQKLADDWQLQSEDASNLKSCRRPENVVTTPGGLQLRTRLATNCKAKWSTGFIISQQHYKFGYFEAEIKAADIDGLNNAFWLVTEDHFEIDIAELHFPNINRMTLHNNNNWATEKDDKTHAVGFDSRFNEDFFRSFHTRSRASEFPDGIHFFSLKICPEAIEEHKESSVQPSISVLSVSSVVKPYCGPLRPSRLCGKTLSLKPHSSATEQKPDNRKSAPEKMQNDKQHEINNLQEYFELNH